MGDNASLPTIVMVTSEVNTIERRDLPTAITHSTTMHIDPDDKTYRKADRSMANLCGQMKASNQKHTCTHNQLVPLLFGASTVLFLRVYIQVTFLVNIA